MTHPALSQIIIPSGLPFPKTLAQLILDQHRCALPDLRHVHIIVPNAQAARQLRLSLGHQVGGAFLSGFIGSLSQWLCQYTLAPDSPRQLIGHSSRQLLLLEALKQFPQLFAEQHHWQVCDSLLELFDELSLSQNQVLDGATPEWISTLRQAYQLEQDNAHLNQEATVVQTLWQAWQQQLEALDISDEVQRHRQRLLSPLTEQAREAQIYLVGIEQMAPLEQFWVAQHCAADLDIQLLAQGAAPKPAFIEIQAQPIVYEPTQSSQHPLRLNNQLLELIYATSDPLLNRAQRYQALVKPDAPALFLERLKLYDAQSAEQEAQAIDLQVRQHLLQGKQHIAIVTENRKLARRLRALLERANVSIQDTAGWALATTSAATTLERWLQCIEQDFAYQPLLDLLKSPFYCAQQLYEEHLNWVYRFERDIVLHENIANDLSRYLHSINNRRERLNLDISSSAEKLVEMLSHIEQAATALRELYLGQQQQSAHTWYTTFMQSLQALGLPLQLAGDEAGKRVLQVLQTLGHSHQLAQPQLSWQDFRTWLNTSLEREQFKPHEQACAVSIMNMQQAQYGYFDALIIAGANRHSLPGAANQQAFFNQSVRQALQLKHWQQQKQIAFYRFQQLLLSAPEVLITWQSEQNGEWLAASPWVSTLVDFSHHGPGLDLYARELQQRVNRLQPVTHHSPADLNNITTTERAAAVLDKALIPADYSASRHQRLIDCPYQFFAADALGLKPLEQISLELQKNEYGELVHLILQAFHQQVPGLPAPFSLPLTAQNKSRAMQHMQSLSRIVFSRLSEDSIQHRGWYERWMQTAEAYIDWQLLRQQQWKISQLEAKASHRLNADINLSGRLDRIDQKISDAPSGSQIQYSIIDYKTGSTDQQQEIELAEKIQLCSYASLIDQVDNVIYLQLDKGAVKQKAIVEGDLLEQLKADIQNRLEQLVSQIQSQHPLPAWGDSPTCQYCQMQGLCRKQAWEVGLYS